MTNGWSCSSDSRWPHSFLATPRQARWLYLACLLASFASMLLLAYTASTRTSDTKFPKHIAVGAEFYSPNGNVLEGKTTPHVLDKNSDNINKETLRNKKYVAKSSIINYNFQAPIFYNCSQVDTRSELLSMQVPRYNPHFKNPCWYEDLTDSDVYANNKFAGYYRNANSVFMELTKIWKKRFQEENNPRRLRCLPYFFVAGQPKCGSTDLYQKLSSHPDVVSPPIKESHWWGKNRYGWRSNYTTSLPFSDYVDLYDKVSMYVDHVHDPEPGADGEYHHQLITGDASVSTLWDNDEWWRLPENCGLTEPKYTNADYIHHFLPNARIIVILRDPVDRLWSDYLYFQKNRKSPEDFHQNVLTAINYHINCTARNTLQSCLYNRTLANLVRVRLRIGFYYAYLENWLNIYPREQFLILRLEDYAVNTKNVIKHTLKFLGLRDLTRAEADYIIGQPVANVRRKGDKKFGRMHEETRQILEQFYELHNKRLALLLNDSRFTWKDNPKSSSIDSTKSRVVDPRAKRSGRIMRRLRSRTVNNLKSGKKNCHL